MKPLIPLDRALAVLVTPCANCKYCDFVYLTPANQIEVRCIHGIIKRSGREWDKITQECPDFQDIRSIKPVVPAFFEVV